MSAAEADPPTLRVVRGEPSDDELAAVVAVFTALTVEPDERPAENAPRSRWSDRASLVRPPVRHGPGAWRASTF
ncbi:acyl-CoA carboxylase subunit epsilon [Actinophytocola xanthii]|uniref:Acetyl-CoA carboxylase biotin carboxyl carrier protein subunit n=1 Tax=Actinophytocola xanthii TaxID=1912961 RepID=A0A1Q8BV54_9PSEU|nr:acyl-CoA carboxylase subunit epsilon [Actinophytocola xanthii]OLF05951.1 acetyl-CoA carboxylase biotin carboxyl carrier protein subunit [Actinophytocola xanthii]